jgi:hypothetical protein
VIAAAGRGPGKSRSTCVHPDPRATGANPGGSEPAALAGATGIVLSCWDPQTRPGPGQPGRHGGAAGHRHRRVTPGGQPSAATRDTARQAAAVRAAGATELRLYHAGLAAAPDLAAIGCLGSTSA